MDSKYTIFGYFSQNTGKTGFETPYFTVKMLDFSRKTGLEAPADFFVGGKIGSTCHSPETTEMKQFQATSTTFDKNLNLGKNLDQNFALLLTEIFFRYLRLLQEQSIF